MFFFGGYTFEFFINNIKPLQLVIALLQKFQVVLKDIDPKKKKNEFYKTLKIVWHKRYKKILLILFSSAHHLCTFQSGFFFAELVLAFFPSISSPHILLIFSQVLCLLSPSSVLPCSVLSSSIFWQPFFVFNSYLFHTPP